MKVEEKNTLRRLNNCLRIPAFTGVGIQSTSIIGMAKYARDCEYVLPKVRGIVTLLCIGESYEGEIEEDLQNLESWVSKRQSEDWQ